MPLAIAQILLRAPCPQGTKAPGDSLPHWRVLLYRPVYVTRRYLLSALLGRVC
ncbi:MAG: hypothetical protein NTW03_06500 [Verrucomicrobia bacterium]|nr:hypothetical protein [Verrucomicrobiota bacterium]